MHQSIALNQLPNGFRYRTKTKTHKKKKLRQTYQKKKKNNKKYQINPLAPFLNLATHIAIVC